jgi:aspartate aminotransferase
VEVSQLAVSISERAKGAPASPIRKLVPFANAAKARGTKVYHLNIGQPDIETPEQMWERIRNFDERVLAYGDSAGLIEFRRALVPYYQRFGINVTPEEMLITTGGSEALLFSMLITTSPGDEVIIPEPFYANYNGFASYAGIKVVPVTATAENGFRLPPKEAFLAKIGPKTRAILLCNPGNPTGVVYTREELQVVADLVKEHNLFVISDEVYREFVYDGSHFNSILTFPEIEQQAILADSISKRFSACGARIGCLISKNQEVMSAALRFGQARLCPPTLEQVGAIGALTVPESYYRQVHDEYQKRRDIVMEGLKQIAGAVYDIPKGAFYVIVKLPIDDSEEFTRFMLQDFSMDGATTMVAPAAGFYATPGLGKDEVRIAYVLKREDLEAALRILAAGVKAYREANKL